LGHDPTAGRTGLAQLEVGDAPDMPAILISFGPIQEEVLDGPEAEPGELDRAFGPNSAQGPDGSGEWIDLRL